MLWSVIIGFADIFCRYDDLIRLLDKKSIRIIRYKWSYFCVLEHWPPKANFLCVWEHLAIDGFILTIKQMLI